MKRSINSAQAALEKGVSASTIRRWCASGKLNGIKKGRGWRVILDAKFDAIEGTVAGKKITAEREKEHWDLVIAAHLWEWHEPRAQAFAPYGLY